MGRNGVLDRPVDAAHHPSAGKLGEEPVDRLVEPDHAFLEQDARPWPLESPLWADEWQLQFAALWLFQQLYHTQGIAMTDLHDQYAELFEPEPDGKTPVTVRGFDWYEDTTPQDYLEYTLLLEQFAADLLAGRKPEIDLAGMLYGNN